MDRLCRGGHQQRKARSRASGCGRRMVQHDLGSRATKILGAKRLDLHLHPRRPDIHQERGHARDEVIFEYDEGTITYMVYAVQY